MWFEYYEKRFIQQDETGIGCGGGWTKGGQCGCKPQHRMLRHQVMQTQKWLLNLCRILYSEIYAKFKIVKHLSSELQVNKGLRQDDAIAIDVYVVLKVVSGRYTVETRGNKLDTCSQAMAYANNLVIM